MVCLFTFVIFQFLVINSNSNWFWNVETRGEINNLIEIHKITLWIWVAWKIDRTGQIQVISDLFSKSISYYNV